MVLCRTEVIGFTCAKDWLVVYGVLLLLDWASTGESSLVCQGTGSVDVLSEGGVEVDEVFAMRKSALCCYLIVEHSRSLASTLLICSSFVSMVDDRSRCAVLPGVLSTSFSTKLGGQAVDTVCCSICCRLTCILVSNGWACFGPNLPALAAITAVYSMKMTR